jgi:hypothetical protein
MRRNTPPGGAFIDHIWYPDATSPGARAAQEALDERRRVRRARLLALIEAERGGRGDDGEVIEESGGFIPRPPPRKGVKP